jgi:predicted AlkP superfamily phosphohydrolase/phosphomutase
MSRPFKYGQLLERLFEGIVAGLLVGILLGFVVGIRLIQMNNSLYSPVLQAELKLHMAVIYGLLMAIPGMIVGVLVLGRRSQKGIIAQGIFLLGTLLTFYYVRGQLSIHIFSRAGNSRWIVEVLGAIVLGVVCWTFYRLLIYLKEHIPAIRGWTTRITLVLIGALLLWSITQILIIPSRPALVADSLVLPTPKENVKVALIGIDGAWWEIIDPLMKAGRMPVFQSLVDRGVRSSFQTFLPTQSPLIWTTIVTGKMPEKHHITSFSVWEFPITGAVLPMTYYPASCWELNWMSKWLIHRTPINSTFRTTKALWNMLSDAGLSVGVINWWASYPVEPVNGYIVSDHALYNTAMRFERRNGETGDHNSVYPPELLPELKPLVVEPKDITVDSAARFIHFQTEQDREWYENTMSFRVYDRKSRASVFRFSYPEDKTMIRCALHLLETYKQPDFFGLYLNCLDPMEHMYLPYYFHEKDEKFLLPENTARLKDLVPEYYVFLDGVLGQILATLDSNTIIIIVSDHGFDYEYFPGGHYEHSKAPPGVFVMAGNNIKHGETISASVKDVTPTILTLFGLPVGKDMDGRALTEVISQEPEPVTYVDTYDTKDRGRGRMEPSPIDKAILERLRALGYFK